MQHDETLDHRIRQALDRLPDAPPPGSAFDATRLWDQLRPELATLPANVPTTSQRTRWWVAAAVIASLLAGLGWWTLLQQSPQPTATRTVLRPSGADTGQVAHEQPVTAQPLAANQRPQKRTYPAPKATNQYAASPDVPANVPTELLTNVPTPLADVPAPGVANPNVPIPVLTPTQPASAVAVRKPARATYLKRGFRVVHENDLLTDDEIQLARQPLPKHPDRAEPFVRIGQRARTEESSVVIRPEADAPSLHIPLSRKTIQ